MTDDLNRLNLSVRDIELIESALHTQKKILSVQNEAGGTGAGQKLNELTRLIKRVSRARAPQKPQITPYWMRMMRAIFRRREQIQPKPQAASVRKPVPVRA